MKKNSIAGHSMILFLISLAITPLIGFATTKTEKCPVICRQETIKEFALTKTDKKSTDKLIRILDKATKNTDVYIYLRNAGGSLHEGERIMDAMRASKGRTIVEVIDNAKSMGALIMLNADVVLTKSSTMIMFHMPNFRKISCSLSSKIKYYQNCAKYFLLKYASSIHSVLSEPQWKRFLLGEDVHVNGGVLVERLAKAKLLPRKRWLQRYL